VLALFDAIKNNIADKTKWRSPNNALAHIQLLYVATDVMRLYLRTRRLKDAHRILDEYYSCTSEFAHGHYMTVIAMSWLADGYLAFPDEEGAKRLYSTIRVHAKEIRMHSNVREHLNQRLKRLGFKQI
jgi:hypothetical protein